MYSGGFIMYRGERGECPCPSLARGSPLGVFAFRGEEDGIPFMGHMITIL